MKYWSILVTSRPYISTVSKCNVVYIHITILVVFNVIIFSSIIVFFSDKGSLIGGIIGAGINYWMLFGQTINDTLSPVLASPTDGCFNGTDMDTSTDTTQMVFTEELP